MIATAVMCIAGILQDVSWYYVPLFVTSVLLYSTARDGVRMEE